MEKSRNFQIIYVGRTNICKQTNGLRDISYETGDSPATTLSYWGQVSSMTRQQFMSLGSDRLAVVSDFGNLVDDFSHIKRDILRSGCLFLQTILNT